jgi:hypothetical protein
LSQKQDKKKGEEKEEEVEKRASEFSMKAGRVRMELEDCGIINEG